MTRPTLALLLAACATTPQPQPPCPPAPPQERAYVPDEPVAPQPAPRAPMGLLDGLLDVAAVLGPLLLPGGAGVVGLGVAAARRRV